jgi:serine/threonine-protein phosphatase 6 regulatory subunit 3
MLINTILIYTALACHLVRLFLYLQKNAVRTTAGVLDPPLGNTRLQVARLLAALIATQDMEIHARLAELGTLNVLLVSF